MTNQKWREQNPELAKLADSFMARLYKFLDDRKLASTVNSNSPDSEKSGKSDN